MKIIRLNEGTSNVFTEGYMSRDAMIAELRKAGLPYTFGKSFSDKQIYAMYQKYVVNAPQSKPEKMEDEIDRTQSVEEIVGNGELVGRIEQGKFNVYQGEDIVGSFDSQADAEDAGYNVFESLKETVEKLHTKPNGEYLVKADSGKGYTAFNRNDVAIGGIDDEDADSDDKAIAKFKKNEYSECLNEEYFDTAEYRIQKYEDDIPELMAGMHDDYMEGKLDAARYAEVLKQVYNVLADCDYKYAMTAPVETMTDELNESSSVEEALVEGIIEDEPAIDDPAVDTATESVECEEDTSDCEEEFDYDDEYSNDYDEHLDECSGVRAHRAIMGEDIDDIADDFADREEPLEDKSEDIEFVMTEYVAESFLVDFVEKVDALTYKVGANDHVVTVVFDPKCSEYVYTIDGKGPYSHSSYEHISRDIYDFVMSQASSDYQYDDLDD